MKPGKGDVLAARADARALPIADQTVDLVVTSPPYFALRSYRDGGEHYDGQIGSEHTLAEFLDALWDCTAEMIRVLKPTGSLWVNLGDKYAGSGGHNNANFVRRDGTDVRGENRRRRAPSVYQRGGQDRSVPAKSLMNVPGRYAIGCVDKLGLIQRAEVIWHKTCALPESVHDRVRRSHEVWLHFTTQERYYADLSALRTPQKSRDRHEGSSGYQRAPAREQGQRGFVTRSLHPDGALPGSVWEAATAKPPRNVPDDLSTIEHYAAFPPDHPHRIIQGWCPPDGLVLDPFGGTGTVAAVARALGRSSITVDLSLDYSRLSRWRALESGQAEVLRGERPPRPTTQGQTSLLDLLQEDAE